MAPSVTPAFPLCFGKGTSCIALGTADLPVAPNLPKMTLAEEGAHPAKPKRLLQPALLPLEMGSCRPTPCPGLGVGRAGCILLLWGQEPLPPPVQPMPWPWRMLSS